MQASVVVSTFNRRKVVMRTVQTLINQDFPASDYEIIVVIDGSNDGTASAIKLLKSSCRLVVIEQPNKGLAGARNSGFRSAQGDVIIFLDDDMLCDRSLVRQHIASHRQTPAMIGFGAIFLSDDSPRTLAAESFNRELGSFYLEQKQYPQTPLPPDFCAFGNTSILRHVLNSAGGFDERFRMREDAELGVRLSESGVSAKYVPDAVAYQIYNKTANDLIRDAKAFAAADLLFARTHPTRVGGTQLGRIARDTYFKNVLRRAAASNPTLVSALLAPLCGLGELFIHRELFRRVGFKALQFRRVIHYYHEVLHLKGGAAPAPAGPQKT